MAITIDWATKVITVPQSFLTLLTGSSYQLNTNEFRIALKDIEDDEAGIAFPKTHNHNTVVTIGGIQYARTFEIINGYTVTFEDIGTPYKVFLIGSNNNILDVTNLNNVSVSPNNSAGLINVAEVQYAAFNNEITIDVINGAAGAQYPMGTLTSPVNNLAEALLIATARGFDQFRIIGNLTIGATDNVAAYHFYGQGATLNVPRTTVTMTQGCVTSNTQWHNAKLTGYQGGESLYTDCIIDGIENAHCIYTRCGLMDGTTRGYTIKQSSGVSGGHASYFRECFSDEGTAIIDRNGARLNQTYDGFSGRIKFINQNHATQSGSLWIHLNGGTVTVDASCTAGSITVTGTGTLVNESAGTKVDATAFLSETTAQMAVMIESLRETHQGFGARWFVDPVNGNDLSPGNSSASPLKTLTAAIAAAVSGRGDVIYLLAPGAGAATVNERIVVNKEDLHIRGPGRGIQIQPSTADLGDVVTIDSDNCSISGIVVRSPSGSTTDNCITVNGKFSQFKKLYLVGSGVGVGSGSGFRFRGGDYHELINCESEKMGRSGLLTVDAGLPSGSPREITVLGGNYYLNGSDGIELTGNPGNPTNSTRIMRIKGANLHDNNGYGLSADANTTKVVIDAATLIHGNLTGEVKNLSPSLAHEVHVPIPAADVATAVLAAAQAAPIWANAKRINDAALTGTGVVNDEWGPA